MTPPNLDLFPLTGARMVPVDLIQPGAYQCRKRFAEGPLEELALSVKQHGVMQPVLLRTLPNGRFELVAGERRWRASKMAGLETMPAVARDLSLMQVLELQAIENTQREDLHPIEEADSYHLLVAPPDGSEGYTPSQVAEKVSKTERHVRQRLVLCSLIPPVRDAFWAGTIGLQTAVAIARMPVGIQGRAWPMILTTRASDDSQVLHKDAEKVLHGAFMLRLANASFPIKDATLLPDAGACDTCPKRTGANPDLFDDAKGHDTCTDPDCHAEKVLAHNTRLKDKARADGLDVIDGKKATALLKFGPDSTALNGDYVYMDEPLEELTGNKNSLKKLLGELLAPSALFEHPRDHTLREIVQTAKAKQALKDNSLLQVRPSKGEQSSLVSEAPPKKSAIKKAQAEAALAAQAQDKADQERDKQVAAELAWRTTLFKAIHKQLAVPSDWLIVQAVIELATKLLANPKHWDLMATTWGWQAGTDFEADSTIRLKVEKLVNKLPVMEVYVFAAQLAMLTDFSDASLEDHEHPEDLLMVKAIEDTTNRSEGLELLDWKSLQNSNLPHQSPPPASVQQGAPAEPVANATQPENTSKLPGYAGQKVSKDRALWTHQWVKVANGPHKGSIGQIVDVLEDGTISVCLDSQEACTNMLAFSDKQLRALPGQKRPEVAA